jgi:hypothetical protein
MRQFMYLICVIGPKRKDLTRSWRRLHSDEIHELFYKYFSGHQIMKNETGEAYTRMWAGRGGSRILFWKPEEKSIEEDIVLDGR